MNIELSVRGQDPITDLRSLEDWLLGEPALTGCPVTRPAVAGQPSEMGAISDVLVVALGSGGMGAALAGSLSVWLRTRVGDLTLRICNEKMSVELKAGNVADAEALIKMVAPMVTPSDSDPA